MKKISTVTGKGTTADETTKGRKSAMKKSTEREGAREKRETATGLNMEEIKARIAAADGTLYFQALERIPEQKLRFHRASLGEGTREAQEAAWREFSVLAQRAFRTGRLWSPLMVYGLAPLLLAIVAEQDELERVVEAFHAAGDNKDLSAQITSELSHIPTLVVADSLAAALEADRNEGRFLAGYLSDEAQPSV
jgi:hypothetical protein